MARVPQDERFRIVNILSAGVSQRQIAAIIGRSAQTVNRIIQVWRNEGRLQDQPHLARPRSTTEEEDTLIIAASVVDPFQTPRQIRDTLGLPVSAPLISKRLVDARIHSRIAEQKPLLTKRAELQRLCFAESHK